MDHLLVDTQKVKDIVQRELLTCRSDESVVTAAKKMTARKCSSILIVENDVVLGIWTERDVLKHDFSNPESATQRVCAVMHSPVKAISGEMSLRSVSECFAQDGFRHYLVLDEQGERLGIVSQTDVVMKFSLDYYLVPRSVGSVVKFASPRLPVSSLVSDASLLMRKTQVDAVVIEYPAGEVGIITERDIVKALASGKSHPTVAEFATMTLLSMSEHESLFRAKERMVLHNIRHLGVLDGAHQLIGIINLKDVLAGLRSSYIEQLQEVLLHREEKLCAANHELKLAHKIIASTQEGVIITDSDLRIQFCNAHFTLITGYEQVEVIGLFPSVLSSGAHDAEFYAQMWASISTTGNWQGEIWNRRKNGECYPERLTITAIRDDESGEISNYAGIFSDLSQSKFNEERIKQLAFYDHLTGLPNRRLLIDRMQHAMSNRDHSAEHMAVMFIDLDNFKVLNDSKGHAVGDQLLKEIARRLVACVREQDTIARLGGDEFVVLIEGMSKNLVQAITEMQAVAAKILKAVSRPYLLGEHTCFPSCSIGVSLFHDHESTIDSILKQADTAMYAAKKQGGDNVRLFNPHMQTALENRVRLEADLRIAIAEQQFVLHYQVQVKRLNKIVVTGAEVLLRWNHPTLGAISPAQFIPVAEEAGLIIPIGNWVIETVCQRLKLWQADELTRELILSVNVSAIQLRQSDFVSQVVEAIQRHAINPVKLKLELTESMLLDNIEEIITKMTVLKNLGVQFSLDDFGTGYSSLQYLKRLPLSQLKVDQSFVRDIHQSTHDRSIVRTIIAMAEGLDLEAIAEGVETEEQQLSLVRKGCNHFQGYFFGKPLPVEQFEASLVCND